MAKRQVIPLAPAARLLQNAGAKRVSNKAAEEFSQVIEDIAEDIGERAVRIAKHSGRKTVQDGDVRLASRQG